MADQSLRSLLCERFKCPIPAYEERAFRRCLYWPARFSAPAIRRLSRGFFSRDFEFIRSLGESAGLREAFEDSRNSYDLNRVTPSLPRTSLRIRVSGRRANRLAERLFSGPRELADDER